MLRWSATLATIVVTAALADAAYVRTHAVDNNTFLDTFSFFEGPDPTHGFVDFVSRDEALKSGLLSGTRHRADGCRDDRYYEAEA